MTRSLHHLTRLTLSLFTLIAFTCLSSGQISVFAKAAKPEFIAYERANINITITNRAGRPISFKSTGSARWIEFIVESNTGQPVHAARNVDYKPTIVDTGRSVTSKFMINQAYDLSKPGNYTAYAIVRMPGQSLNEGFRSNKVHFDVINGHVVWKQRAGVPGSAGDMREYRIINVTGKETTELYIQVKDIRRQNMLETYSMGRNLSFRKFTATLDNKNNLHVLFLTNPTLHCHTVINPSGKTIYREYHKKGAGGVTPKLITNNTGVVGVVNSTLYDPKKELEERRKIHNLSELPIGL